MGAIATRFKFKAEETENCEGEEDKAISNKKTFSPVKWVKGFRKKIALFDGWQNSLFLLPKLLSQFALPEQRISLVFRNCIIPFFDNICLAALPKVALFGKEGEKNLIYDIFLVEKNV